MGKPEVFNYQDYVKAQEKIRELEQEVEQLRRDRANLEIRNRILRADGFILFECDGIKCGTNHKCDGCHRTTDINHAKNFCKNGDRYFEKMKLEEQE